MSFSFYGQEKDSIPLLEKYILIEEIDTLGILLDEVILLPKHKFKSKKDVHYYNWLRKKVYKAYPYAKLASERLDTLNSRLKRIKNRRKKRKYIKIVQKYLEGEFTGQLKNMTRTEGRILIKLIHRQTGKTAFRQVKELRSGWRAFWYNTTANLFKLSLKTKYNPGNVNEDFLIEDILQRAFINENLEESTSRLEFDYYEIYTKNKGVIDVDKYKKMFSKMRKKKAKKSKAKK